MTKSQYYTFEHESKLPKLPVPSLISTAQQLLGSLKPLLPHEEFADVVTEATDFVSSDIINLVQKHLVAISENEKYPNYLNFVNNDMTPSIYGEIRGDILPRNPYLILEEDPYSKTINPPNQAQRAANLINSSLKFIITLRNETLKPDITPKSGNPLTMRCYRNLFGTTRVPEFEDHNYEIKMRKYEHINDSRHILIIANNQYYTLEVITEYDEDEYLESKSKHKIWFNDHELSLILQQIIDEANKVDAIKSINNSIGSITTQTVKHWKAARVELELSNPETIKLIDDALFVLILDSNSPESNDEKTAVISHGTTVLSTGNVQVGTCTSRWYDKLQLIVTQNSVAGVVWESMSMDSTAILRFISDIYTDSVLKLAKNINGSEYTLFDSNIQFASSMAKKPEVNMVHFNKTKELHHLIHLSETRLADLINQHEYLTHRIKLDSYLTSKFNLSIDSIMQICFQIAYYSLYGKIVNTLEPITTRKFMDSRTELIPIQNEVIGNLVKLYITSASSSEKFEAFKKCCELHTTQYRDAMIGKGFERHLMTIIQVIKKPQNAVRLNEANPHLPPIPDLTKENVAIPLLLNSAIEKLSSPELLISNCGNPALKLFGIPPAIDQGFGVGYIIHRDKVLITVCSKHRQTERFLDTFHRVIRDLKVNLRQRSNFLLSISDSEQRKAELQRLRIENELSHVSLDEPTMRHPIPLTVGKDAIPIENVTVDVEKAVKGDSEEEEEDEESKNFSLMGGYGYFDFGELELRSDEVSRNQSYINSQAHSGGSSALSTRRHSFTNLLKVASRSNALAQNYDVKEKQSLSERIRDKLSHSNDTLPSVNSSIDSAIDDSEAEPEAGPAAGTSSGTDAAPASSQSKKSSIGRTLITKY